MVLRDNEIKSLTRTLKEFRLRLYTEEERMDTDKKIAEIFKQRQENNNVKEQV